MEIKSIVNKMTLEEKAALVSGHNFMYTNEIPSSGIPSLACTDGPHGLRKQSSGGDNGVSGSEPSTAFPTAATTASGWNIENVRKMGEAIAEECRYYGVDVLLGPAVNIKKNPLCGRNFEYFSEDPFLTAEMGVGLIEGVQSRGVGVSVKHFAANNSENYRFMGNSVADDRALREIYLKAFERIVKQTSPASLMCAYNRINGEFCSENKWLLDDVLRKEWGFDGIVMTDWGATKDRIKGVEAGLDLEMPGDTCCRDEIIRAAKEGKLSSAALDTAAERMLGFVKKWHSEEKTLKCDFKGHHELAAQIAEDCAVLLKNDGMLPLKANEKILVVGDLFEKMRYQGAGSSMINPTELISPKAAFDSRGIEYAFAKGYIESRTTMDDDLINEAVKAAKNYEKILVFAGLTDFVESEGGDRADMRLPENQYALIDSLVKKGKKIAVVLYGGSPVEVPFAENVSAILEMYLPGQNGGEATAALLFGEACPCGKLAETWPKKYSDVPFGDVYGKRVNEFYKESIFVGYRYYSTAKKAVRYPFGYGLSYTSFRYSGLSVEENGDEVTARCEITNEGKVAGAEIVQLYVGNPEAKGNFFADRELRAFDKVYLEAGETKSAVLRFRKSELRFYAVAEQTWKTAGGSYRIMIGASAEDIRLTETLELTGEETSTYSEKIADVYGRCAMNEVSDEIFAELTGKKLPEEPKDRPITIETRLDRYKKTFFGKFLYNALTSVPAKMQKSAKKMPEGIEKNNLLKGAAFLYRIMDTNSARTLSMSAGKNMPYHVAQGFAELANGHPLKAIRLMKKKVIPSKLPAEKNSGEKK